MKNTALQWFDTLPSGAEREEAIKALEAFKDMPVEQKLRLPLATRMQFFAMLAIAGTAPLLDQWALSMAMEIAEGHGKAVIDADSKAIAEVTDLKQKVAAYKLSIEELKAAGCVDILDTLKVQHAAYAKKLADATLKLITA